MMKHEQISFRRIAALLAVVLLLAGIVAVGSLAVTAAPTAVNTVAALNPMPALPAQTCSTGCALYAETGTLNLPDGGTVPIWGFSDTNGGAAGVPGPVIIVNEGDTFAVDFTNNISGEMISLYFGGIEGMVPDLTGIGFGETKTYTITAANPGTYRYEAGLTENGGRQVMMGLFGAFIVRPAATPMTQAYNDPASAYNKEALLIFHEVDPDFNNNPNTMPVHEFHPHYRFINGKAYNDTEMIVAAPGDTVLLRYLNAGVEERSMGVLGLRQTVIATDGFMYPYSYRMIAETIGAGATMDTLVQIPNPVMDGQQYSLYNTGVAQLHNNGLHAANGAVAMGGMYTYIQVNGGDPAPTAGPLASNVVVSPTLTAGNDDIQVDFDLNLNSQQVIGYRVYLMGVGTAVLTDTIATPANSVHVTAMIPAADVNALTPGIIPVYVQGLAADGTTWGPVNSTTFELVVDGPTIPSLFLSSSPANGTKDVTIHATADSTIVSGATVAAAEYFLVPAGDAPGANGTGTPFPAFTAAPIVELVTPISAADIDALTIGSYEVLVHAQDNLGNWGGFYAVGLTIDKVGPAVTMQSLRPNPNNGYLSVNSIANGVRLEIRITDDSEIKDAEMILPLPDNSVTLAGTAPGDGVPLIAKDALYDSNTEDAYVNIPLATVRFLNDGVNTVYFRALDAAGNWGDVGSAELIVDKTGPDIANLAVSQNPTNGQIGITLTADATDPAPGESGLAAAEWYLDVDPGVGNGTPMLPADGTFDQTAEALTVNINVSRWRNGIYTLYVRGKDRATNWGPASSITIEVKGNSVSVLFTDGFETNNFVGWDTTVGNVQVTTASAMTGDYGLEATYNGVTGAYLVGSTPPVNQGKYDVALQFDPNGSQTGTSEQIIFQANDSSGNAIFGLMYGNPQGATSPEIMVFVNGGLAEPITSPSVHVIDGPQNIALVWNADTGSVELYVNRVAQAEVSGAAANAMLSEVVLGPSAGLEIGVTGTQFYDSFVVEPHIYQVFMPFVSVSP